MRRLIVALTCLCVLLILGVTAFASQDAQTPSTEMMEYVTEKVVPYCLRFFGEQKEAYVGSVFSSAEEINKLVLGAGYKMSVVDASLYGDAKKLSDVVRATNDWLFFLCTPDGTPKVYFKVTDKTAEGGGYGLITGGSAESLAQGINVMIEMSKKTGTVDVPTVVQSGNDFILLQQYDGEERVITVNRGEELDGSYLRARDRSSLPTGSDALNALMELERFSHDSNGNFLYGAGSIHLTAVEVPVSLSAGTVLLILAGIGVAAAAVVAALSVRRK